MLGTTRSNSFSDEHWNTLRKIVHNHIDAFCVAFSLGPPAHIPQLRIDLPAEASPVKCRLSNLSLEERVFMTDVVNRLVVTGMACSNPTPKLSSAPLIVLKYGKDKFRFTMDLRAVNRSTIRHHYLVPLLKSEFTKFLGSKFYANFDLSHEYWQLLKYSESQERQSFLTPAGIYTPTRVLHWAISAVTYLQSALSAKIPGRSGQCTAAMA